MTLSEDRVTELIGNRYVFEYDLNTEMTILRQLDELLVDADIFWDIGAHAGMYSSVAAQIHPDLDIYCFEASAVTREKYLEDNVSEFDRVSIVPHALADRTGEVSFQESGVGQTNNSLLSTTVAPDEHETISMKAHTARSAVDELGISPPDAVKLDVEGAEHRLLQGFGDRLLGDIELLLVELHHIHTEDNKTVPFLETNGFTITRVAERRIDEGQRMEHILAQPA